jgi:hypothetical protein
MKREINDSITAVNRNNHFAFSVYLRRAKSFLCPPNELLSSRIKESLTNAAPVIPGAFVIFNARREKSAPHEPAPLLWLGGNTRKLRNRLISIVLCLRGGLSLFFLPLF